MKKKIKLMSHLVAGYPTDDKAFTAAKALVDGVLIFLKSSFRSVIQVQMVQQFKVPVHKC